MDSLTGTVEDHTSIVYDDFDFGTSTITSVDSATRWNDEYYFSEFVSPFAGDGGIFIFLDEGNDLFVGSNANDIVFGEEDNDRIFGNGGDDRLIGGNGHDMLDGGSGNDFISGGSGMDIIDGDSGDDILTGGEGSDTYLFNFGLNYGIDFISDDLSTNGNSYGHGGGNDALILNINSSDAYFVPTGDADLTIYSISEILSEQHSVSSVTIDNFYLGGDHLIETIQFLDGSLIF